MQLPNGAQDQCVALVDIGDNVMNVDILRNGTSVYTRDQQIGGAQLTQQIQTRFGLSAEEAKRQAQRGLPENYESDVLTPFWKTWHEVTRALQFSLLQPSITK
jgi:type IV pilus assembly protein PilM